MNIFKALVTALQYSIPHSTLYAILVFSALASGNLAAQVAGDYQHWRLPSIAPQPADNLGTPERIELGKMLFFDTRLSGDGTLSCASCHLAQFGWSDRKAVSLGIGGKPMDRNSQSLVNIAYNTGPVMWAGQKLSLEDQINGPMKNPNIMATDIPRLLNLLNTTPAYKQRFEQAYPGEEINLASIGKAIANFERSILSQATPFDQWLAGKRNAMTGQQLRGLRLFTNEKKTNCVACHRPPNFTDYGFHNIGLASTDIGRYQLQQMPVLMGAFKTPQLRDVEHKAPFMHNGSLKTLMEVVEHYNQGNLRATVGEVSVDIRPLHLSAREKADLVAFLKALSGPVQKMAAPILPE
ncbi:cytochrome-c peroxidase [Undibacterium parvum]|uniref:Tryptophan tryptophylquinone biosynthesis enzyme MauG n=1 Tax=Undibacterium parvum TaxID=401471 RepID=A0A3Q9BVH5_9BURK|nr:cytochrome c peroxidase [Undibacterium parvum]AZP14147.1 tryptophan tryptophylquinone biosynthesis enzyme MauG [Undibacterium parvum]